MVLKTSFVWLSRATLVSFLVANASIDSVKGTSSERDALAFVTRNSLLILLLDLVDL